MKTYAGKGVGLFVLTPMSKTLITIVGATGTGKTSLSIDLATRFGTEIISSDSRQIYKGMSIGTAMPDEQQLSKVRHHFIGTLSPNEYYSAARFENEAIALLRELFDKHEVIVMAGGSMMYIDALCNGIDDIPTVDVETREFIKTKFENEGLDKLAYELKLLDPDYYSIVDRKNPKRIMHALEICYMTGKTYTSFRKSIKKERDFKILKIGLLRDRNELYERINLRVDKMIQDGLVDEVKRLLPYRNTNALNTVGYKEIINYIDGKWDLEYAVEKIKQNTRIYSRKQMTWFKKDSSIKWFNPDSKEEIFEYINEAINAQSCSGETK